MFKAMFQSGSSVGMFPILAMFFFFIIFLGIIIWAVSANKKYLKRMSELPLDD